MFDSITKTPEFNSLLNAVSGKPTITALFGLPSVGRSQIIASLAKKTKRPIIIVTPDEAGATRLSNDIAFFGANSDIFPARDLTLRGVEGQNREYEYRRLSVLGDVVGGRTTVITTSLEAALQYTVPKKEFCKNTIDIKTGMNLPQDILINKLFCAGYYRRDKVDGSGQFSVRGGIVDIDRKSVV